MAIVPYKFSKQKQRKYLTLLRRGARRGEAAKGVGITRQMVHHYMRETDGFREAVELAEMEACEPIEEVVRQLALDGDLKAAQYYLSHRAAGRWGERLGKPYGEDASNSQHYHQHVHLGIDEARSEIAGLITVLRERARTVAAGNGNGHTNGHANGNGRVKPS